MKLKCLPQPHAPNSGELRPTVRHPRILREPEFHLTFLLGNQNFLAQPHDIHLAVGTPLLRHPLPCGKRLRKPAKSHTKVCFFIAPLESQGVDESEDWLPWKVSRHRAIKKAGSKAPAYQQCQIPSSVASRGVEGDACFPPHGSVMGRQKTWDDAGEARVKGHREILLGGKSWVSGLSNLSWSMQVWYRHPPQHSCVP